MRCKTCGYEPKTIADMRHECIPDLSKLVWPSQEDDADGKA